MISLNIQMRQGDWLERLKKNVIALPDEAQCHRPTDRGHYCGTHSQKECLGFDITYPEVIKRWRDEAGRNLNDAACTCRIPFKVKVEQTRLPYKED